MKHVLFLCLSYFSLAHCSAKEDIVLGKIDNAQLDGHHNHRGTDNFFINRSYNEQRRDHLPESSLIHSASTSVVSQRTNRGAVDLHGVPRFTSDDSLATNNATTSPIINLAATIAIKTESECCNPRCCIDEDTNCRCTIQ